MKNAIITACPVCQSAMQIERLGCLNCKTRVEGSFMPDVFAALTEQQKRFVVSFIKCRGNIREMEKELGISYPTVRGRLEDIAQALGQPISNARREALDKLQSGEIDVAEALALLTVTEEETTNE